MSLQDKIWFKLMKFGSFGCHQLPERSFKLKGYQFPICARCSGLYLGNLIGIILIIFSIHLNYVILVVLIIPTFTDGLVQAFSKYESNNYTRFITGIIAGISISMLALQIILTLI